MLLFKVIGAAMTTLALLLLLRRQSPLAAMAVAAAGGILVLLLVWEPLLTLLETMTALGGEADLPEGVGALILKGMGISLAVEVACSLCAGADEKELAHRVEMAGRVLLLSLAMPVLMALARLLGEWAAL